MKDNNIPPVTDEELMKLAQRRVKQKQQFKLHLIVYILVNVLLVIIFFTTASYSPGKDFWPRWPIFGWGIGVIFHGVAVFSDSFDTANPGKVMKEYKKLKDAADFKSDDNGSKPHSAG